MNIYSEILVMSYPRTSRMAHYQLKGSDNLELPLSSLVSIYSSIHNVHSSLLPIIYYSHNTCSQPFFNSSFQCLFISVQEVYSSKCYWKESLIWHQLDATAEKVCLVPSNFQMLAKLQQTFNPHKMAALTLGMLFSKTDKRTHSHLQ